MGIPNDKLRKDVKILSNVLLFKHNVELIDYDEKTDLLCFLNTLQDNSRKATDKAYEIHHITQMNQDLKNQMRLEKQFSAT